MSVTTMPPSGSGATELGQVWAGITGATDPGDGRLRAPWTSSAKISIDSRPP